MLNRVSQSISRATCLEKCAAVNAGFLAWHSANPSSDLRTKSQMKYWREPLDLKDIRVPHGEIHVLVERCKGCGWCVEFCPRDVLEVSDEINSKGYHPPRTVRPEVCVSCGLCELLCPEFAIYVVEEEGEVVIL